jgi:hypothetical protein
MNKQLPVQESIEKFLADNQNLAGSRDGFPALALNLNRVRELAEYVDNLKQKEREKIKIDACIAAINIYDDAGNFNGNAVKLEDLEEILEGDGL